MRTLKHKLVIVTSSKLVQICDSIIANNLMAERAIRKAMRRTNHKKMSQG